MGCKRQAGRNGYLGREKVVNEAAMRKDLCCRLFWLQLPDWEGKKSG